MSTLGPVAPAALLSVRLPPPKRDRLRVAAESRGETVQDLVGSLIERFLAEKAGAAPPLTVVLCQLCERADDLRARGIASLTVFGSIARGDARPGSDIDLLAGLDPAARLSLIGLSSLRAELSELLGAPADLVERGELRPGVCEAAEGEAVRAW